MVGGFNPLKTISQLGWFFPIYGKIKNMFQTTNQIIFIGSDTATSGCCLRRPAAQSFAPSSSRISTSTATVGRTGDKNYSDYMGVIGILWALYMGYRDYIGMI